MRFFKRRSPARHVSPKAQDFHAAFGLGETATNVNPVDAFGVALTAVQGLHQLAQEQEARLATLEARLAALEQKRAPVA